MKKTNTTAAVSTATAALAVAAANVQTAGAEVIVAVAAESKASKANAVFREMFAQSPVPARKDMIARAKQVAGLTDAGAATYLQNFKSKNGLVQKKADPVATKEVEAATA